jgi:molecular chaperone DnaK (HSP70)
VDPATGAVAIDTIVPINSTIPIARSTTYYISRDGQERLILEVVCIAGPEAAPTRLGLVSVRFQSTRRKQPVLVTLGYDAKGRVKLTAKNQASGEEITHEIDPPDSIDDAPPTTWRTLVQRAKLAG